MKERLHIVGLSDTHGLLKVTHIPVCDVVTISGDFSPLELQRDTLIDGRMCEWIKRRFIPWLMSMPCDRVVFIAGNHDFITEEIWFRQWFDDQLKSVEGAEEKIHYLCFDKYEYKGWVFYGCPVSDIPRWAWTCRHYDEYKLPEGVDIALYHQAPDHDSLGVTYENINYGSARMYNAVMEVPDRFPALLLCGHIHSGRHRPSLVADQARGKRYRCLMCNVSIKDEIYAEHFYPRYFELTQQGSDSVQVETWMSFDPDQEKCRKDIGEKYIV